MEAVDQNEARYNITSADDTKILANDVARFIAENKLFHNIQGKEYVNVEGWQYAGSRLGILPQIEKLGRIKTDPTENPVEVKYGCKVVLFDLKRQCQVGSGFAICSNREPSKKYYQEFALASMAQTRAIGKAYRNILAWIIRAAGYEPTPAEEMDYLTTTAPQSSAPPIKQEQPKQAAVSAKKSEKLNEEVAKTAPTMTAAPVTEANPLPVRIDQKTAILLKLNVKCFTQAEKDKMIAKFPTMSAEVADAAIARLNMLIKERGLETGETASSKQIELIEKYFKSRVFSEQERIVGMNDIVTGKMLKTDASATIEWLENELKARKETQTA